MLYYNRQRYSAFFLSVFELHALSFFYIYILKITVLKDGSFFIEGTVLLNLID